MYRANAFLVANFAANHNGSDVHDVIIGTTTNYTGNYITET